MELHRGDCLEIVPKLTTKIDAVATDPPYGASTNTNNKRFTKGGRGWPAVAGDDRPFDPAPWIVYPKVCLWGFQFFASSLPIGTVLVWNKKRSNQLGKFLSDAELAWVKGGRGCYAFNHVWVGADRDSERGSFLHPTQKPVALWKWVLGRMKLDPGATVLDPYMGSGSCGLACAELGLNYVGIEIDETYFATAQKRLLGGEPVEPLET